MKSLDYLPRGFAKKAQEKLFYEGYDTINLQQIYETKRRGKCTYKKVILQTLLGLAVNNYQKKYLCKK